MQEINSGSFRVAQNRVLNWIGYKPEKADQHALTFKATLPDGDKTFQPDKCSQFFGKLNVPYEAGTILGNQKKFEFNVPIRALPINPGILEITSRLINDQLSTTQIKLGWGESSEIHLSDLGCTKLTFKRFDGKTDEIAYPELENEVNKSASKLVVKEFPYFKLSQIPPGVKDNIQWKVETVPPVDL